MSLYICTVGPEYSMLTFMKYIDIDEASNEK